MRIAIIGAGFTGLSAAKKLIEQGHEVVVLEKDKLPGGLAIGYKEKGWKWTLEYHYHHWFTNDDSILKLAEEIGHKVVIKRPNTSSYIGKKIYQLDSPVTLLKFPLLNLFERIRMAFCLAVLRFNPFWKPLEKVRASLILPIVMGKKAYSMLWEPLLVNKFGEYADSISLAWFWARITKRTTSLAYPEGGFLEFAEHLANVITEKGATIHYATEVSILSEGKKSKLVKYIKNGKENTEEFDIVIVTVPSFLFSKITPSLSEKYKNKLMNLKGIGAVNLVMRMSEPFFKGDTYWLSICEKNAPVLAIVEHTNFMNKKYYNNESLVYLGNYLSTGHRYFKMSEVEIMKEIDPFLKKINPNYEKSVLGIKKFVAPFAQPIIPTNYSRMIPEIKTPIKNIYLANMQQVYPWDRGTNYAVELGERVASLIEQDK